jgi:hypothetical protein
MIKVTPATERRRQEALVIGALTVSPAQWHSITPADMQPWQVRNTLLRLKRYGVVFCEHRYWRLWLQ